MLQAARWKCKMQKIAICAPSHNLVGPRLYSAGRPPRWALAHILVVDVILEMCANAQGDGRPAEYRWRPLFNAAKFG